MTTQNSHYKNYVLARTKNYDNDDVRQAKNNKQFIRNKQN